VARHRRVAAYLASERRLPFNEEGIFRHYPELDG
jgi:glutathione S-transferase